MAEKENTKEDISEAICLVKDHPELKTLKFIIEDMKKRFEEEVQELKNMADQKANFFEKNKTIQWNKIKEYLKENKLLPKEYDPKNPKHRISISKGVVLFYVEEENSGMPGFLQFLGSLPFRNE